MGTLRTFEWVVFAVMIAASLITGSFAAAPQPAVSPKMLLEGGDVLNDEILAFQRLRAERRVALDQDDSLPIVCRDSTGLIYLVTGSGKLVISNLDAEAFSAPSDIVVGRRKVTDVQAMGVLKSDKLIIAYGDSGRLYIARSEDGGATWIAGIEMKSNAVGRIEADGVHIVQLADGTLLLPLARVNTDGTGEAEGLVYASKDEGKTWGKLGSLGPRCAGANILQLKSGELLAAITYRGKKMVGDTVADIKRDEFFNNVAVAHSSDGGRTWGNYQCVTRFKEAPADLIELSDGTVVLTYGQQNRPCGARAVVSKDGGKTWSSRVYLLGNSTVWAEWRSGSMFTTGAGWRVSSIVLKGDTILTLYTRGSLIRGEVMDGEKVSDWYRKNRGLGEKAKAILSLRWSLDGLKKPPLAGPAGMTVIGTPDAEGYLDNGRHLIKPEHMNEGGDYIHQDEILIYDRVACERHYIGPGGGGVVALDPEGNPVWMQGAGVVYRSKDNGRTWDKTGQVPEGCPWGTFGVLRDGTFLVCANGSNVYRSEDGGKTWSSPFTVSSGDSALWGGYNGECTRIIQLPDGTVLMNLYFVHKGSREEYAYVCRSRDGGKTWGDYSLIFRGGNETNFLSLKSGRLLASVRDQSKYATDDYVIMNNDFLTSYRVDYVKSMAVVASDDGGYTWTRPKTLTRHNEQPGDVVEMADGTVVMSYMQKSCQSGARAMISRDGAKTWGSTIYMLGRLGWMARTRAEMSWSFTSSVPLKDGRVLTVGTGWSIPDKGHVAEAIIWKPVEAK